MRNIEPVFTKLYFKVLKENSTQKPIRRSQKQLFTIDIYFPEGNGVVASGRYS